jgi:hypothetical protein
MKLTESQLRYLIKEAMTGLKTGVKNKKGGLDFVEGGPDDEDPTDYGVISTAFEDEAAMSKQLENSAVDVNFIVVPETILKNLGAYLPIGTADLFSTNIDTNIMSKAFQYAMAKYRGNDKMLTDLRKQYDPNAFNIVVQRKDKDNLGFRIDVPWMMHDAVGHALNFANYGAMLKAIANIFVTIVTLGKKTVEPFTAGAGAMEREMGVGAMRAASQYRKPQVEKELMDFFKKENFAHDANPIDVGASIIAYYFMYGKYPDPIQEAAYDGVIDAIKIEELKFEMDKIFKSLIGKVSYVNYGPSSSIY